MRAVVTVLDWLGWLFCELSFRTPEWLPHVWSYDVGCRLYGAALGLGVRHGVLVVNPKYGEPGEPYYVRS